MSRATHGPSRAQGGMKVKDSTAWAFNLLHNVPFQGVSRRRGFLP